MLINKIVLLILVVDYVNFVNELKCIEEIIVEYVYIDIMDG